MKGEMCKLMIEAGYLNAKKKIERKKLSNETTVKKKRKCDASYLLAYFRSKYHNDC